jgi:hypothetical protein
MYVCVSINAYAVHVGVYIHLKAHDILPANPLAKAEDILPQPRKPMTGSIVRLKFLLMPIKNNILMKISVIIPIFFGSK